MKWTKFNYFRKIIVESINCDKIKLDQFKVEKQSSVDELIKLKELFKVILETIS